MVKPSFGAAILLAKKKPDPEVESEKEDSAEEFKLDAAAEAILEAVEKKDADALKAALKRFVQQCPDMDLAED